MDNTTENPLDNTFPPLQPTTFPQNTHVLQKVSTIPSGLTSNSPIIHEPLIHIATVSKETLPKKVTSNQCVEVCGHEICNQARKNIQEAAATKKKDKEKYINKLQVGFKSDNIRSNLVAFSKRKAKCKKKKQGRGVVGEGMSLNDLVNDEFSEEEEIDDECENVKNIGKSLGIYRGENQKDFCNNKTFD